MCVLMLVKKKGTPPLQADGVSIQNTFLFATSCWELNPQCGIKQNGPFIAERFL